jgi:serine-type D-Ala-D-Ala carboxypeptidase/endopeptidase (penicillin-binding protein 4)
MRKTLICLSLSVVTLGLGGCATPKGANLTRNLPAQTRLGLVVADASGREIVSLNPDARFTPASNTKIFTTATAFARLDVSAPARGTAVALEGSKVVLIGAGDASLIDAPACAADCLSTLADAVAATGVKQVTDIIGDDTLFPDERWGPGWSWDDMQTLSGAAVSALTINNNVVRLEVAPGREGEPLKARWRDGDDYLELVNETRTLKSGEAGELRLDRLPGSQTARLLGSLSAEQAGFDMTLAVEDPAHFTAWRFKRLLVARGIVVTGEVRARHRSVAVPERLPPPEPQLLARLNAPRLADDLSVINKQSQNLHAELMLRRLSVDHGGTGSIEDGLKFVRETLMNARPALEDYDFSDGSGLSTYGRVTPRLMVRFLNWTQTQGWGEAFTSTLPIGGVDGSLRRRFAGTALQGKIFAKTGRLNSVNTLSGFMIAKSGKKLTFSAFANDRPLGGPSANPAIDQMLVKIAQEN